MGRAREGEEMGRRAGALVVLLALGVVLLVAPGRAAAEAGKVARHAGEKLVRGVVNLGTGWTEMVEQPYVIGTQQGWLAGTLRGPIEGLGMTVARTLGGAYEILTFPLPIPSGARPMVEPGYVWQDDPEQARPRAGPGTGGGGGGAQDAEAEGR